MFVYGIGDGCAGHDGITLLSSFVWCSSGQSSPISAATKLGDIISLLPSQAFGNPPSLHKASVESFRPILY